ncbi:MAG: ferredoxin-thioredoxin reductase catalytic domain-containing protein [Promethearchaeota archaeon]
MKTKEDAKNFSEMVAKKQGWKLNRDTGFLTMLFEGLATNFNRYGYYSCPCRDADCEKTLDKDIICPCDYCAPDMQEYGHCYCGMYLTKEFYDSEKVPKSIPERRC